MRALFLSDFSPSELLDLFDESEGGGRFEEVAEGGGGGGATIDDSPVGGGGGGGIITDGGVIVCSHVWSDEARNYKIYNYHLLKDKFFYNKS